MVIVGALAALIVVAAFYGAGADAANLLWGWGRPGESESWSGTGFVAGMGLLSLAGGVYLVGLGFGPSTDADPEVP